MYICIYICIYIGIYSSIYIYIPYWLFPIGYSQLEATHEKFFPEANNPDTLEYTHNDELKGYTNLAVAYSEAAYMFTDRDSGTAAPVSRAGPGQYSLLGNIIPI